MNPLRPKRRKKISTGFFFAECRVPAGNVGDTSPDFGNLSVARTKSEMDMGELFNRVLFVLLCLVLPMLWGVTVNWIYNFLSERSEQNSDDETIFPDYQI